MKIVGSNSSPFEFSSMKNLESDLAEIRILFVGLEKIMRILDQLLNLMLARSVICRVRSGFLNMTKEF